VQESDAITGQIIGAAIRIHRKYGPGLLESVYRLTLVQELVQSGLMVEAEKPIQLEHEGLRFERAYLLDLIVEGCVIVEVKSVEKIIPIHVAQLLTYLRLMGLTLGLIINFNVRYLKNGVRRVVNGHNETGAPWQRVPPVGGAEPET
jgi:GxxExxY protein